MMSEQPGTASKPDYNVIPVQLRAEEFEKFILSHLSLPKRGPQCKLGYHKPFNYILKVLYTGMQWKELPIDKGLDGKVVRLLFTLKVTLTIFVYMIEVM